MSKEVHESWEKDRNSSDQALEKLLIKINLIDSSDLASTFCRTEYRPILHYALAGLLDETEAIVRVAEELQIEFYQFEGDAIKDFERLLKKEPLNQVELVHWSDKCAIPIESSKDKIKLVMANPLDTEAVSKFEFIFDRGVEVVIGRERDIQTVLASLQGSDEKTSIDMILKGAKPLELKNITQQVSDFESSTVDEEPDAAVVVRLVNKIFTDSIQLGASDIHITPQKGRLSIRGRVDGILRDLFDVPETFKHAIISRIKLLSGMDISERRRPQDGRLRLKTPVGMRDLRISTVPAVYGENVVVRILATDLADVDLPSLGMADELREQFERCLRAQSRVVLVTGPTGSGKTSTLYGSLLYLHDGSSNIITLEDPIEYRIDGISQIQVNAKTGMTFASGLRSILRQDPDIVLVGEVRDEETAAIVMQTAQTGHLVLSTLHTNSAGAAITRLRDLGVPSYLISSSLGAVLAQRLVRKLCTHCAEPLRDEELDKCLALPIETTNLKKAVGCEECKGSGYKGRVAVFSLLEVSDAVETAIRSDQSEQDIAYIASQEGFVPLRQSAYKLLENGITSYSEIERVFEPLKEQPGNGIIATTNAHKPADGPEYLKSQSSKPLSKRKVLLVEDSEDTRSILTILFETEMFEVVEASNGREGLEKLYKEIPDIIVSDVMMPNMDGIEMLKRIRNDSRINEIPILMLTANDSEEAELQLMQTGADEFISKTTNPEILLARMHRLLKRPA